MGIQVDTLVKDKKTYEKEFIDFEFDGKHISDFGMVAVFDGDRHTFSSTSEFEDETSEVAGVNGQYFWGTKLKPLEKEFSLATDGMTERQVNEFKHHFQPGRYGKFIECATSNRWRWARIASAPEFKVIPFKKEKIFGGKSFYITEYKGEAAIKFIFDNPYSYAITKRFDCNIIDAEPWQLKVAYEDGIPFMDSGDIGLEEDGRYNELTTKKIYNPSNIASDLKITIYSTGVGYSNDGYLREFDDEYNSPEIPYSTINIYKKITKDGKITEEVVASCRYTSPDIFYSYNKVISFIKTSSVNITTKEELIESLREEISNTAILSYAIGLINLSSNVEAAKTSLLNKLRQIFQYKDEEVEKTTPTELVLDGIGQMATVKYHILPLNAEKSTPMEENCGEIMLTPYLKFEGGDSLDDDFEIKSQHYLRVYQPSNVDMRELEKIEFEYTYI